MKEQMSDSSKTETGVTTKLGIGRREFVRKFFEAAKSNNQPNGPENAAQDKLIVLHDDSEQIRKSLLPVQTSNEEIHDLHQTELQRDSTEASEPQQSGLYEGRLSQGPQLFRNLPDQEAKRIYPVIDMAANEIGVTLQPEDKAKIRKVLSGLKVFGISVGSFVADNLPQSKRMQFVTGLAVGAGTRYFLRIALSSAGLSGIGLTAAVAAASGGLKEYWNQRKEIIEKEKSGEFPSGVSQEIWERRNRLKRELARASVMNKKRIVYAVGQAAVFGTFGFVAGNEIVGRGIVNGALERIIENRSHYIANIPNLPFIIAEKVQGLTQPILENTTVSETVKNVSENAKNASETVQKQAAKIGDLLPQTPQTNTADTFTSLGTHTPQPMPEAPAQSITADSFQQPNTYDYTDHLKPHTDTQLNQPQEHLFKPSKNIIELPVGSNPWTEVEKYMTEELAKHGKTLTEEQLKEAVAQVVKDSGIKDATKLPVNYPLDITGVNQMLSEIINEKPALPVDVASLPQIYELPAGSNLWEAAEEIGGGKLTPEQHLLLAKELAKANNIAVDVWRIEGEIRAEELPVGYKIKITDNIKSLLESFNNQQLPKAA